jgi:hypothetical protein
MEANMILKWIVVAVLYVNGEPINSKIFVMPPHVQNLKDCEAERDGMLDEAKKLKADVWVKCVEVDREMKPQSHPQGVPGTLRNS